MHWLLLLACTGSPAGGGLADSGDLDGGADAAAASGTLVLAGGGSEGDIGEDSWSAAVYGALLAGGDVTGDGLVTVAVLATGAESDWLPEYFVWLGADRADNHRVADRGDAEAIDLSLADVVFIKGGDQGEYYDAWNDTALEAQLRALHARGGGIGGTSAGAMSLGEWALAGGRDLVSDDVLVDSQTSYLDDDDGGSGVHPDFLGLLPGVVVDTHFTERGRLGRLLGVLAAARDQGAPDSLLGLGIEQRTGVVVRDGLATVHGVGGVSLLQGGDFERPDGRPLQALDVRYDVLTEGGVIDLATGEVQSWPDGATEAAPTPAVASEAADWAIHGDSRAHEERCAWVAERDPQPFAVHAGADAPLLDGALCVVRAHETDERAVAQEALLAGLAARPGAAGFLVAWESALLRAPGDGDLVRFAANPEASGSERGTIVIDGAGLSWTSASPVSSPYDTGDGSLRAAGLGGLRVHVLSDTAGSGLGWDQARRMIVEP